MASHHSLPSCVPCELRVHAQRYLKLVFTKSTRKRRFPLDSATTMAFFFRAYNPFVASGHPTYR